MITFSFAQPSEISMIIRTTCSYTITYYYYTVFNNLHEYSICCSPISKAHVCSSHCISKNDIKGMWSGSALRAELFVQTLTAEG